PYVRGTASKPMRLWLLKLAGNNLARILSSKLENDNLELGTWNLEPERSDLGRLRGAMSGLSSKKQAVLSLALFEALSAEEIAAASGVPLPRAMRLLRAALRQVGKATEEKAAEVEVEVQAGEEG